ncbi:hypothetical protein [Pseudofrankia sp. BMG5.36]|uniref:hypothetical protein n=1 Tax=Pseudofrankia sp. BMG5.36 TaxID=1834512 RepID=UPI0018E3C2BE|nr:hypothetical protein [Pseudofrankia sp. BMG5.36]
MCGRLAAYLDGPATVTLRRPPPLATPLAVDADTDGSVRARHGGALVAEAEPARDGATLCVPDTVSAAEARAAEGRARYFQDPLYPACFVCGIRRGSGDGLRIFAGRLPGRDVWAAPWAPDASLADGSGRVPSEIVWAALDCPSGIAAIDAADLGDDAAVLLGRMTATVAALPAVGDECRVIAWPLGRDGRKLMAGSALLGAGGEVLAAARAVWLTVPRSGCGMPVEEAS